jgi:ParB family chromosome partitioning protein
MIMTTQMIPLNKLQVSVKNVRKAAPDKDADKRLMASIASQGVLQNLVVMPEGKDTFGVVAGGRRLRALQALAKAKTVPSNLGVICMVKDKNADITEISLAENVSQEAMHPADAFVAYAEMVEQGVGIEDIAAKFGVTKKVVQQRLKLGQVAPELLEQYRLGNLNLDCMMAFTVGEQERQLACFKELSGGYIQAHTIKRWIMGEAVSVKHGIGAFVGKAAYIKSNGVLSEDLFEDTVFLSDTALVHELAQAKLERAAKKLEKETNGWMWIDTTVERHETIEGLIQLDAEHVGVPKALETEMENLAKQIEIWEELQFDDELAEGFEDEETFSDAIEAAVKKFEVLENKYDEYLQFSDEQKAYSGCVVTFDRAGKLDILKGWARRKDMPKQPTSDDNTEGEGRDSTEKPKAGLTQALVSDLGNYRQQATKAALLKDPTAAADVLHYTLCMQVVSGERWQGRNLQDASFTVVESKTTREDTAQGRAFDELAKAREALSLEWTAIEDAGERFAAFRKLNKKAKDKLVAYCTVLTLNFSVRDSYAEQDKLIEQLDVDFAGYWRPTKDNYFGRLTKGQMFEQFGPVFGQEWLDGSHDMKKGAIAEGLEDRFNQKPESKDDVRSTWIPEQF